MISLFASEAILFVVAALIGFAIGWRLNMVGAESRRGLEEREVEHLRHALSDAQVRRARAP